MSESSIRGKEVLVRVQDPQDGSGDLFVPLSDDIVESLGWKEGERLVVSMRGGNIVVEKAA